jgi:hypothetical protein
MTLADRLQSDMTTAMRSGDALRRDTLRMVLAAAHNAEVAARRPLSDDELLGVLVREAKTLCGYTARALARLDVHVV